MRLLEIFTQCQVLQNKAQPADTTVDESINRFDLALDAEPAQKRADCLAMGVRDEALVEILKVHRADVGGAGTDLGGVDAQAAINLENGHAGVERNRVAAVRKFVGREHAR